MSSICGQLMMLPQLLLKRRKQAAKEKAEFSIETSLDQHTNHALLHVSLFGPASCDRQSLLLSFLSTKITGETREAEKQMGKGWTA